MMKPAARLLLVLIATIGLVGCGGATSAPPQTIDLVVTDPPAPTLSVEVPLGAEVTLRITTPTDDRAHVHGYEIEEDLPAGQATDIVFTADMSGTYEVESHITDAVWLNLVVK